MRSPEAVVRCRRQGVRRGRDGPGEGRGHLEAEREGSWGSRVRLAGRSRER